MDRRDWFRAYHSAVFVVILVWFFVLRRMFSDNSWQFLGSCLGIMEIWFFLTLFVVPKRRK